MHRYLIALGSNRCHPRHGSPRAVLRAAGQALAAQGLRVIAAAPVIDSAPLGPSLRTYANGAVLAETTLDPPELLACLQAIEAAFGRRRRGQRWSSRVLDLDIVLWCGGSWTARHLTIPHPQLAARAFVLGPARRIAPRWRVPPGALHLAHLHARLTAPRPLPKRRTR